MVQMVEKVDEVLPAMDNIISNTPVRKVFNEDLETHLRTRDVKIAVPLQVSVCTLLNHLEVEGLFRVGPRMTSLRRAKSSLDASVPNHLISKQFEDPHIFTAIIKAYLRELKDPIFCSSFSSNWSEADAETNKEKQVLMVKRYLKIELGQSTNLPIDFGD